MNELIRRYGQKPRVSRAFRRAWDADEPMILTPMLGTASIWDQSVAAGLQQLVTLAEDQELFDVITDLEHTRIEAHLHHQNEAVSDFVPFAQIQKGDKNTEVCVAQDALWALGYRITKISGVFDSELDQQVRAFQRDQGLNADGIVGRLTWKR
ncbi:MAG: peptidoglycan-binding domain-containing protein [Holdemania massiliensis]